MTNNTKGFLSGLLVVAGVATIEYNVATALFAIAVGFLGIREVFKGATNV